jgi:hypothetical protein
MHHSHHRDDFGLPKPERPPQWRKRFAFLLLLLAAASVTFAAGYGLGRGAWTLPDSIVANIPRPLVQWLTPSDGQSESSRQTQLKNYAFELVRDQVKQGETVLSVRLIDKRSGRLVPDALVFARRLDMAPAGMPTMTAQLQPQPDSEPGIYRLKTNLTMPGEWQLSLGAKVQGETGTLKSQLVLNAVP